MITNMGEDLAKPHNKIDQREWDKVNPGFRKRTGGNKIPTFSTKSNKSVINSVKLIKDAAGYNLRVLDVNCCYIRIVGKDGL